VFKLFYDVQSYADVSLTTTQTQPSGKSITAGDFSSNLQFTTVVTSHGCNTINDVTLDVEIDTPEGVVFYDIDVDGQLNNKKTNYGVQVFTDARFIRRTVDVGSLAPGQSKTVQFNFIVCQNARAGNGGVRLMARFSPRGNTPDLDVLQSTTTGGDVAFVDLSPATDFKVTNPEDDQTSIVGKIVNVGALTINQSCTDPVLIPRGVRPELVLDDSENTYADHHRHKNGRHGDDDVADVKLQKVSVCTLVVLNAGASDVAVRLRNEWDLPSGVHVASWQTTSGVFSNNVWVLDAPSTPAAGAFVDTTNECPARTTAAPPTLTVTLVAQAHGIVQWVTKLDTTASAASFTASSDTGKFTSVVF